MFSVPVASNRQNRLLNLSGHQDVALQVGGPKFFYNKQMGVNLKYLRLALFQN